jgi:NADH:ubiquinone oxidoreductase subunit D
MKSIAHLWSNAQSYEQEAFEFFGVEFSRIYENKIFSIENKVKPLLKGEDRIPRPREVEFNDELLFDQPFLTNQVNFKTQQDELLISKCQVESGQYHIGLEKLIEGMPIQKAQHLLENYYPQSGPVLNFLVCHNIELTHSIDIPDRAKAIRMIVLECHRILNHFNYLRQICLELRNESFYASLVCWIKKIQSLIMSFSGNEYFSNIIRVGGISTDADQTWLSRAMDELEDVNSMLLIQYKSVGSSNEWRDTLNFTLLTKTQASLRSLTGPIVRSVGLNLDLRKSEPFYFYKDVNFEIPIGSKGTAYDLMMVKIEEVFQSLQIIFQVLDNLPTGPVIAENGQSLKPSKLKGEVLNEQSYLDRVNGLNQVENTDGCEFIEGANGFLGVSSIIEDSKFSRFKISTNDQLLKSLFEQEILGNDIGKVKIAWLATGVDMKMAER